MVAFEPCLATSEGGWRWVRKHHHIYTIPYLYHTGLPTYCRKSAAQVHLPSTDDLNKAIRESLFCFGVLANAASAS